MAAWADRKERNIRAIISSLHEILWEGETRWNEVGMHQLVQPDQVRVCMCVCACVHWYVYVHVVHAICVRTCCTCYMCTYMLYMLYVYVHVVHAICVRTCCTCYMCTYMLYMLYVYVHVVHAICVRTCCTCYVMDLFYSHRSRSFIGKLAYPCILIR